MAFVVVLALLLGGSRRRRRSGTPAARTYVGVDDERVGHLPGPARRPARIDPTLEQRTDLLVDDVAPARRDDLARGKEVPSLDAARTYVANLREEAAGCLQPRTTTTTTTAVPPPPAPAAPPP